MNAVANAESVAGFVGDHFHRPLESGGGIFSIASEAEDPNAFLDAGHPEDKVPFLAGVEVSHGDAHDDIGIAGDAALEQV